MAAVNLKWFLFIPSALARWNVQTFGVFADSFSFVLSIHALMLATLNRPSCIPIKTTCSSQTCDVLKVVKGREWGGGSFAFQASSFVLFGLVSCLMFLPMVCACVAPSIVHPFLGPLHLLAPLFGMTYYQPPPTYFYIFTTL